MSYVCALTRLKLRSIVFLPQFLWLSLRCIFQGQRTDGLLYGAVIIEWPKTFYTITIWSQKRDMLKYLGRDAHLNSMPRLPKWCCEAGVTHFQCNQGIVPSDAELKTRLRNGKVSHVLFPSADHYKNSWNESKFSQRIVFKHSKTFC
jgi:hypothetical protein